MPLMIVFVDYILVAQINYKLCDRETYSWLTLIFTFQMSRTKVLFIILVCIQTTLRKLKVSDCCSFINLCRLSAQNCETFAILLDGMIDYSYKTSWG